MNTRTIALATAVLLAAPAVQAATVVVLQEGNAFVPDDVSVDVGDTVQWVWTSGSHTVTNGTGADDPHLGTLFDAVIDNKATTFSHVFGEAYDVPYLCRPHLALGMTGIVRVRIPTPGEAPAWGAVKSRYR